MKPQPKIIPWRSTAYRNWIRNQDCCLTGAPGPNDPHHENIAGKSGMGTKISDEHLVPIQHNLHVLMESPGMSRQEVWHRYGKDPQQVKKQLQQKWVDSGHVAEWLHPPFFDTTA